MTEDRSDPGDIDELYEEETPEERLSPESENDATLAAPSAEPGGEPEEVTGIFYVKHAEEGSATLHEVNTAQICTLSENPGFERHEIVRATLKPQPPLGVSYLVENLVDRYEVPVEKSPELPTKQVKELATTELEVGDAIAIEREGKGEIHVLSLAPGEADETAEELLGDEMTYKNAARYAEVTRVEIRTDDRDGIVSIRYMP